MRNNAEVNLQKVTSVSVVINLAGSMFIDANPAEAANIINLGFPLIKGVVTTSDTVRRRYKDLTIAKINSQTHVDSIYCFTDANCDIVGHDGLAYHLIKNWSHRYSNKRESALRQAKRFTDRKDFPKKRLFGNGCWLFCSTSVDHYIVTLI